MYIWNFRFLNTIRREWSLQTVVNFSRKFNQLIFTTPYHLERKRECMQNFGRSELRIIIASKPLLPLLTWFENLTNKFYNSIFPEREMYARIGERATRTKPPLPTTGTKTLLSIFPNLEGCGNNASPPSWKLPHLETMVWNVGNTRNVDRRGDEKGQRM